VNTLTTPLIIALAFGILSACTSTVEPPPAPAATDKQADTSVAGEQSPAPADDVEASPEVSEPVEPAAEVSSAKPSLSSPKICLQPRTAGRCKARFAVFGFDPLKGACVQYFYGGCEGSENRFSTMEECNEACNPSATKGAGTASEPK